MSRQVEHLSRTFALSGCHIGAQSEQNHEFLAPLNSDTSHTAGVNLSSAVHIGQRLAVIGDELHRTYEQRFESKMALIVRASMRIANNCQAFALSVLRSVKHITSRVDPGGTRTAVNSPLVSICLEGFAIYNTASASSESPSLFFLLKLLVKTSYLKLQARATPIISEVRHWGSGRQGSGLLNETCSVLFLVTQLKKHIFDHDTLTVSLPPFCLPLLSPPPLLTLGDPVTNLPGPSNGSGPLV
ncbi:hypothetical protein FKM82_011543 [Ascaphus truei]